MSRINDHACNSIIQVHTRASNRINSTLPYSSYTLGNWLASKHEAYLHRARPRLRLELENSPTEWPPEPPRLCRLKFNTGFKPSRAPGPPRGR
eukprot:766895-Hanusia_phi.AAC.5